MSLARREKASVGRGGRWGVFLAAPQGGDQRGTRNKGALCVYVLTSGERARHFYKRLCFIPMSDVCGGQYGVTP